MNTTENNKLIAEFMGIKPIKTLDKYTYSDMPFFSCSHDTPEEVMQSISEYAKYHKEWNWLMPVVEKIDKTPVLSNTEEEYYYCVCLMGSVAEVMDASTSDNVVQVTTDTTNWLESTYKMCVEFIKWYNQNK